MNKIESFFSLGVFSKERKADRVWSYLKSSENAQWKPISVEDKKELNVFMNQAMCSKRNKSDNRRKDIDNFKLIEDSDLLVDIDERKSFLKIKGTPAEILSSYPVNLEIFLELDRKSNTVNLITSKEDIKTKNYVWGIRIEPGWGSCISLFSSTKVFLFGYPLLPSIMYPQSNRDYHFGHLTLEKLNF